MGNLRLSVLLVGAAACGSNNNTPDAPIVVIDASPDAKVFLDAPPPMFDFSCLNNNPPTVAAQVTLSGVVSEGSLNGLNPLSGATVDACIGNCLGAANKLGTATSDAQGAFTLGPITTGGTAIDGYLKMTNAGDRPAITYPHAAIAADAAGVPVLTFQPLIVSVALPMVGCTQDDSTNGMLAVVVNDCMGTRITDGTGLAIAVKQGGNTVGDQPIDAGNLSPMAAGVYLICNVPENATTNVSATYNGMDFLAHDIGVTKGTIVETEVRPGY